MCSACYAAPSAWRHLKADPASFWPVWEGPREPSAKTFLQKLDARELDGPHKARRGGGKRQRRAQPEVERRSCQDIRTVRRSGRRSGGARSYSRVLVTWPSMPLGGPCKFSKIGQVGPRSDEFGQFGPRIPASTRIWPNSANLDRGSSNTDTGVQPTSGPKQSHSVRIGPESTELSPKSTNFGPTSTNLGPMSTKLGPDLSNLGRSSTKLGPKSPRLG